VSHLRNGSLDGTRGWATTKAMDNDVRPLYIAGSQGGGVTARPVQAALAYFLTGSGRMKRFALLLIVCASMLWVQPVRAMFRVRFDDAASIEKAGATTQGDVEFVESEDAGAAHLEMARDKPASISIPTRGKLHLEEGTLRFRLALDVKSNDGIDQPLVTARFSQARYQFQVRKSPGGSIAFILTEPNRTWRRLEVRVTDWKPGTWHTVQVSWLPGAGGGQTLILQVDDETAIGLADAGLSLEPESLLVGGPTFGRAESRARTGASFSIKDLSFADQAVLPHRRARCDVAATVDVTGEAIPMRRVADCVTPWNSSKNRVPFAADSPQGRVFRRAGFKLVRLVGYSEGWLYGVDLRLEKDGFSLDFKSLDANLDLYASLGATPYIRLAYHMPKLFSKPAQSGRHALLAAPPDDWDTWRRFVREIATHVVHDKKSPVEYWVASLNESDMPVRDGLAEWEGVCRVYAETARIIKAVQPEAKVGGPALAGDVFGPAGDLLAQFLAYCRDNDVPLDFICYHAYRRSDPAELEVIQNRVRTLTEQFFPDREMEYFLDEFNLWARDVRQNTNYAAAYLAASLHYQLRAGVTKSSIVAFNPHLALSELRPKQMETPGATGLQREVAGWPGVTENTLDVNGVRARVFVLRPPPGALVNRAYIVFDTKVPACESARISVKVSRPQTNRVLSSSLVLRASTQDGRSEQASVILAQPAWRDLAIDASAFAGELVRVEIAASPCSASGTPTGSPVWVARPVLVIDGESKMLAETSKDYRSGIESAYDWTLDSLPLVKGDVVTPALFAYEAFNRLGDERLAVELAGRDGIVADGRAGIIATRGDGAASMLLWNFDPNDSLADFLAPERAATLPSRTFDVVVKGLGTDETYCLRRFRIDARHTNAFADYQSFLAQGGRPGHFKNIESARLAEVAKEELVALDGVIRIKETMPPASVGLITLEKTRWHFVEPDR